LVGSPGSSAPDYSISSGGLFVRFTTIGQRPARSMTLCQLYLDQLVVAWLWIFLSYIPRRIRAILRLNFVQAFAGLISTELTPPNWNLVAPYHIGLSSGPVCLTTLLLCAAR